MQTRLFSLCALCATFAVLPLARAEEAPKIEQVPSYVLALAGYAPLRGEGVVVTLSDRVATKTKALPGVDPGLVHDYDLLSLVNELRAAGAQGIAVNGVRLTAQTAIRAVGSTIRIGGKTTSPPFQIEAVGVAGLLGATLKKRGGLLEQTRFQGPHSDLLPASQISLPAAPLLHDPAKTR